MAIPIVTTSAIPPGSTVYVQASAPSGFQTSSFANDLFNSLAPLLTLFGEQPTRQYLSMSLSFADHILLGIAPIGILTIVVSALRISGSLLSKALVGRSRENRASIEAEVLSFTSTRVRELWDGERIVKEAGESRTIEVIYRQIPQRKTGKMLVKTFPDSISGGMFRSIGRLGKFLRGNKNDSDNYSPFITDEDELFLKERLQSEAPNLSLNVPGAIAPRAEIWTLGAIGYVLQLGVLVAGGLSVYWLDWRAPNGASIPAYGYPCFAAGTVIITTFSTLCGFIIEATTTKEIYEPTETMDFDKGTQNPNLMFRVQRESTVGRQDLPAYAIFNDPADDLIRTSRPNKRQFRILTSISTVMTVLGFAAQFIGLRAMHWSNALMQLGAAFITTGLRSWARRGMTCRPEVLPLETRWEAVDLALHIRSCDKWQLLTGEVTGGVWLNDASPPATEPSISLGHEESASLIRCLYRNADRSPEPSTVKVVRWALGEQALFGDGSKTPRNLGHRTIELHRRLQKIFPSDNEIETVTSNICEAITKICTLISSSDDVVLADLDTAGQPADPYVRPLFDVLVAGKASSEVPSGLIQLELAVKLPGEAEDKVVDNNTRKRIRSIISLSYRSLLRNQTRTSDHSINQRQTYFMRILGYRDPGRNISPDDNEQYDHSLQRSEFIRRWVDHGRTGLSYHKIPFPDGTKPMLALDASIQYSQIFGMRFSSLYKIANLTTQLSLSDSATGRPRRKQSKARLDKETSQTPPTVPTPFLEASELVFLSDANLVNNIALDILSTFLLELAAKIEKIGGTTTAEVDDRFYGSKHWENNVLEKLSQILINLGLANNMLTAKSVIIPAFATRWLLPPKTARTASEGIRNAQIPSDWTRRVSESRRTYFANRKTKVTSWTHPWYQKPDDMWRELHSDTPPPAYTPPPEPKEPRPSYWSYGLESRKPQYPPSQLPEGIHRRAVYQYEDATGFTAGPASLYSEQGGEESNESQTPPRRASC